MSLPYFDLKPGGGPGRFTWIPAAILETPAGSVQGGASLGAAITAMETVTERPLLQAGAQFLSFTRSGEPVEVVPAVEAAGRSSTQASCRLSTAAGNLLLVHGSLGSRPGDVDGTWCSPPEVPDPSDCEPFPYFRSGRGDLGDLAELRSARLRSGSRSASSAGPERGCVAIWVRCWQGEQRVSAADLSTIGDFLPVAFAEVIGKPYIGNSLDNLLRVGRLVPTEWVLMVVHVDQVIRGFGHARAELWSRDGSLLGTVSQSTVLRYRPRR